jgi:hypothetical protein
MELIDSTKEILAFSVLNKTIDKKWITWAIDMLCAGIESEHLYILAGEIEPMNQFEAKKLVLKIFDELKIDYNDIEEIIKDYVVYLIQKLFDKETTNIKILSVINQLYLDMNCIEYLFDFSQLYWAKYELINSECTWEWDGATRENIDQIIIEYIKTWKNKYYRK